MSEAPAARLAALIQELVRAHVATAPSPRGLPYLGLEHASGTGFHLLDDLATRGIFRKYELVLDVGATLGGSSRWLAARLGCEAIGTAPAPLEAAAADEMTRRAGLRAQVRAVAATPAALPFRASRFTHVWFLETLPSFADPAAVLTEAYRVVRRGGTIAVQDLVRGSGGVDLPRYRVATLGERIAQIEGAGFTDVAVRDRTHEAAERSAQVLAARAQLQRRLQADSTLAAVAAEREALATAVSTGALRVVQLLARRP